MKKTILTFTVIAALVLSLAGCGTAPAAQNRTPAAEPQTEEAAPAQTEETTISDELALSTIRYYCYENNPDLESIVNDGEHQVSWEIASSSEQEIVILYTSYTGAEIRYYIDRATGDTYSTAFVSGVMTEEERTDESFNLLDYVG